MIPIRETTLFLNGNSQPLPVEYPEIKIDLIFGGYFVNPQADFEELVLVNEAAQALIDHIENGDIYEGIPAKLEFKQNGESLTVFEGYVDCSDGYEEIDPDFGGEELPVQVKAKFIPSFGRNKIQDLIGGWDYGRLERKGVFKKNDYSDLDFVIEDDFEPLKFFLTLWIIFSLTDKLFEVTADLAESIANVIAIATGGISGPVAAAVYQIALLIIRAVYFGLLVGILFSTIADLLVTLISPVYTHKVQQVEQLLRKAFEYWGYEFECRIEELFDIYYLGAATFDDSTNLFKESLPFPALIKKGIPSVSDYGYLVQDMLDSVLKTFKAVITLQDNKVIIMNDRDDLLEKEAEVTLADVKTPRGTFNARDLRARNVLSFATDPLDSWTVRNWKGTSYEVITESTSANPIRDAIKGSNEQITPVALCNRKDAFTGIEESILEVLQVAENLTKLLGQKKDFTKLITNRLGVAKFSGKANSVPKWVYLKGGRIPANHRDILAAKPIWEKYHQSSSWIANDFYSQRRRYDGVQNVPFTLEQVNKLIFNRKIKTVKGEGFVNNCKFSPYNASCDISFEVQRTYARKLVEEKIEQSNET